MIEPEVASRWRTQAGYDRVAALLIGIVAILAACLAIQQAHAGTAGTRAQVMGARLAADAAAHLSAGSLATTSALRARQDALLMGIEGVSRQLQGTIAGDDAVVAVGAAAQAASTRLDAALSETAGTSGGPPLDAYAAGLVTAPDSEIVAEVRDQNRQVDTAQAQGSRELRSVLGLSLVALAGVLAGIAAVIGRGRAGWLVLGTAWVVAGATAATVVAGLA